MGFKLVSVPQQIPPAFIPFNYPDPPPISITLSSCPTCGLMKTSNANCSRCTNGFTVTNWPTTQFTYTDFQVIDGTIGFDYNTTNSTTTVTLGAT